MQKSYFTARLTGSQIYTSLPLTVKSLKSSHNHHVRSTFQNSTNTDRWAWTEYEFDIVTDLVVYIQLKFSELFFLFPAHIVINNFYFLE